MRALPHQFDDGRILGWPNSLDYNVDPVAGTAVWHGTVTRRGKFPVRMTVEHVLGSRAELILTTFLFK